MLSQQRLLARLWVNRAAARFVLRRRRPLIVGVTGSVGKTTTVEIIGSALQDPALRPFVGEVWKTHRNMNDVQGFPFAVLGYRDWPRSGGLRSVWQPMAAVARAGRLAVSDEFPRCMVLEYAIGTRLSSVRVLAEAAPPTIAIVTAVGAAHVDRFGSIEGAARDKRALVEAVPPNGLVILGADNEHSAAMASASRAPVRLVPGKARDFAVAAGMIVGEYLGVPTDLMRGALEKPVPLPRRQEVHAFARIRVMDDAVNANPLSAAFGLDAFAAAARPEERRVAVLGQMGELGPESDRYHAEIGAHARQRADLVVGVGERARAYEPDHWFATSRDCALAIGTLVRPNDFVYLKGSAAVKLALVLDALRDEAFDADPVRSV